MAVTRLKELLTSTRKPGFTGAGLVKLISRQDNRPERERIGGEFTHVSALINDVCPRKAALARLYPIVSYNPVSGAHRVMWEIGRAVEKHVRKQLIEGLNYQNVYGMWHCSCKKVRYEGWHKPSKICGTCGTPSNIYEELTLKCKEYGMSGNPDLIMTLDDMIGFVEIKSITNSKSANERKEGFATLVEAQANHCLQVSSYKRLGLSLSSRLRMPLHEHCIVLYFAKEFDFRLPVPYKTFEIRPEKREKTIQAMFEDGKSIMNATDQTLPPRLHACRSAKSDKAMKCAACNLCFSKP